MSRLAEAGWRARIDLGESLKSTYAWFEEHIALGEVRLAVA
ncbi:hypothetical protein [Hyphomicrobium sp.]